MVAESYVKSAAFLGRPLNLNTYALRCGPEVRRLVVEAPLSHWTAITRSTKSRAKHLDRSRGFRTSHRSRPAPLSAERLP